jgi:hypothetical protein
MAKNTEKPASDKKPAAKNQAASTDQKKFNARFKKATKGKNLLEVGREINNDLPQYRTAEVLNRLKLMEKGELMDEAILEAIEKKYPSKKS